MGLDMYLYAETLVSNWRNEPGEKEMFNNILSALKVPAGLVADGSPSMTVSITACYWRKANAVHAWFVDNAQKGVDECQRTHVSREKLSELVEACKEEIGTRGKSDKMKPRSGFFFGSTEKDEYYYSDLEFTVERITQLLDSKELEEFDFYYRSSW